MSLDTFGMVHTATCNNVGDNKLEIIDGSMIGRTLTVFCGNESHAGKSHINKRIQSELSSVKVVYEIYDTKLHGWALTWNVHDKGK